MSAIFSSSFFSNPSYSWLFPGDYCKSTVWTKEENKQFEKALAIFDENTPDRWLRIACMIPGKSELDVRKQYEELLEDVCDIEAGLVPIPGYLTSPFTLELVDNERFDHGRKRPHEQERKKGVPWTEDEHRRFLLGLEKHGKGDWRNISRNFVISKSPTQVASHAQKYFLRQNSGGKDKRRPSIHDITTANLSGKNATMQPNLELSNDHKSKTSPLEQSPASCQLLHKSLNIMPWSSANGEGFMVFDPAHGCHNLYSSAYQGAYVGSY